MTEGQKRLLAKLRLELGAVVREYFSYEVTMELRDKLTNLIRDEAGSDIRVQRLRPETYAIAERRAIKPVEAS